jgi:hypothetical protein
MTSENGKVVLNTIKGHGLAVGDRFNFHGLASDPLPTVEGTRVEIGKVGAKYMLTTVTGEVMTWEFGASAKVWADTTVDHHVTTEARTLDNGDTVHVGQCEHGWMTGFHTSEDDARDVATGHGEVSRPLYVAPAEPTVAEMIAVAAAKDAGGLAVGDTVVTSNGVVGMVEARYSDGRVNVFGILACRSVGVFTPSALTLITEDMTRSALATVKANGRVFVAEKANFSVPVQTWDVLVTHGNITLVDDGGMSRYVRTRYTADGKRITDGMAVWDYDLAVGTVVLSTMDSDGWFNVAIAGEDRRSLMNGERVITRHPRTGQSAAEAIAEAEAVDIPTEAEVWKGTGTVVKSRRCSRLHSGRRCDRVTSVDRCPCVSLTVRPTVKHKRTKVNARRVRGGF